MKIKRFLEQNNMRIQILEKKMNDAVSKYVEPGVDGKGETEMVDGVPHWKFRSPEAKEKYLSELKEFMDISFKVHRP